MQSHFLKIHKKRHCFDLKLTRKLVLYFLFKLCAIKWNLTHPSPEREYGEDFWRTFDWHIIHWSQNLVSIQQQNELRQHLAQHRFLDRSRIHWALGRWHTRQFCTPGDFGEFDRCGQRIKWPISSMPDIDDSIPWSRRLEEISVTAPGTLGYFCWLLPLVFKISSLFAFLAI